MAFYVMLRVENEALLGHKCAWLAQSVEHETLNLRGVGSSPTSGVEDNIYSPVITVMSSC